MAANNGDSPATVALSEEVRHSGMLRVPLQDEAEHPATSVVRLVSG